MSEAAQPASVKKQLLNIAQRICLAEKEVITSKVSGRLVSWEADPAIFARPIALRHVELDARLETPKPRVLSAIFELRDEEVEIYVARKFSAEYYIEYPAQEIWEAFNSTYCMHEHELCLAALAPASPENIQVSEPSFAIVDRRISARQSAN